MCICSWHLFCCSWTAAVTPAAWMDCPSLTGWTAHCSSAGCSPAVWCPSSGALTCVPGTILSLWFESARAVLASTLSLDHSSFSQEWPESHCLALFRHYSKSSGLEVSVPWTLPESGDMWSLWLFSGLLLHPPEGRRRQEPAAQEPRNTEGLLT